MPPMSPRTQALAAAPSATGDQAKSLFDQGLSQMAYNVLINKLPNISPDVVTFKVLETDPEEGSGVGAFVIVRKGETFYVPVVMAENQIKPLDVLFYKNLNVFLPLSKEWLEELDKMSLGDLGQGATPPATLQSDVDIRNTVVPPTTGRYTYAADQSVERAVKMAGLVFDEARNQEEPKLAFLDFVSKAPDAVKLATTKLFEQHPRLLKHAVWFYGEQPVVESLKITEKVADYKGKLSRTGALYIADEKTQPNEFKDIFGPQAPLAFQGVKVKGYYAKDDRKKVNRAVAEQAFYDLQEPKDAGAYKLWKDDGKPVIALVIGNPVNLFHPDSGVIPPRNIRFRNTNDAPANPNQGHGTRYRVPGLDGRKDDVHVDRYVGVTEDGKLIDTTHLIGMPVAMSQLEGSAVYKKTVGAGAEAGPRSGQTGIFVQRKGASFVATTPMKIESVMNDGNGVRRIEVTSGWQKRTLLTDKGAPVSRFTIPKNSTIAYLPGDAVFVPTSGVVPPGDFLSNPTDVLRWTSTGIIQSGAEKVSVYKPNAYSGYVVGRQELPFVPALRKLAMDANISVEDAEHALTQAAENGKFSFWSMNSESLEKAAAYFKVSDSADASAPPKKSSGGGDASQDPAQAAMDQVMAAQMAQPQGPSPVDMAVAEQLQNLQGQMQALTQMQQLVMNIQQRANMIAGGGGAAAAPGAAAAAMGGPMDPSMMGAGQPVSGMPAQAQQAQQPGMAAQQPGMATQPGQPGVDPTQQDPQAQQGQQAAATMDSDDGTVQGLMGQVNPQFVDQAAQLNDAGAFDAAALASMAQSPALKDLVGAYLPNLEKALDNIGRVLLTLWMDEARVKTDIGNETYVGLEDNLRQVFRGLGDLVLKINQNTMVLRDPNEQQYQE